MLLDNEGELKEVNGVKAWKGEERVNERTFSCRILRENTPRHLGYEPAMNIRSNQYIEKLLMTF